MTDSNVTSEQKSPDGWKSCQPGELTGYSNRVQRRHFLQLAGRTTGIAGCVVAVGAAGWWEYLRRLENAGQLAGLTCSDVNHLMPEYTAGRLDAKRSQLLEEHVRRCSVCANFRPRLRPATV